MKILKWAGDVPKSLVGQRVVMTKSAIKHWSNQSKGTVGTVVSEKNPDDWAMVDWDSGSHYRYRSGDLMLATKKLVADSAKARELAKKKEEALRAKNKAADLAWAKKAQKILETAVHAKGCKYIKSCPREHEECKKGLDFDTAIYWEMAGLILQSAFEYERDKENEPRFKYGLITLRNVMLQHRNKLPKAIFMLLNEGSWFRIKDGYHK